MTEADLRAERMLHDERVHADGVLTKLLVAQLPFAIALAALHGDWLLAIVAGSLLSFVPLAVVRARPGTLASRLTVAGAFMGYSALLIQEAHGATELHFHVFVSLAFLLLYRDWRAPVFGGALIAVHHLVFHLLQTTDSSIWVFTKAWSHASGIEMVAVHGGFVVFEVAVLVYISRALAAETHEQAALLVAQEHDQQAMVALAAGLQSRDLSVGETTDDETVAIGTLRQGIGHVAELVRVIDRTANEVASAAQEMVATTAEVERASTEVAGALTQVSDGARHQVDAVMNAHASAERVTRAVEASATSAQLSVDAVARVQTAAEEGSVAAVEATAAAQAANESSARVSGAISGLATKSEQIGEIVATITGIAEQTNLLALNAAIEAARAGEQGRGFAVVAEEVRKLAEESQQAAGTISQIVQEIQADTRIAVTVVEDGAERTGQSAHTAAQTKAAFERITEAVREMSEQSQAIARATDEIAAGAERMRGELQSISTVARDSSAATENASAATEQTSASTQQVAASAEQLARTAMELKDLVGAFRLNDESAA